MWIQTHQNMFFNTVKYKYKHSKVHMTGIDLLLCPVPGLAWFPWRPSSPSLPCTFAINISPLYTNCVYSLCEMLKTKISTLWDLKNQPPRKAKFVCVSVCLSVCVSVYLLQEFGTGQLQSLFLRDKFSKNAKQRFMVSTHLTGGLLKCGEVANLWRLHLQHNHLLRCPHHPHQHNHDRHDHLLIFEPKG